MNKEIKYKAIVPILFVIGMVAFSCSKDVAVVTSTCTQSMPDSVSFKKNILPVFHGHCSIAGCHTSPNPAGLGHLNLSASVAYTQLMQSGKGYIDTINPTNSILYVQMISSSKPMPPTGNLDACTTQMVLKWIQQKARNN